MKQKRFDSLGRIHIPKRLRDGAGFTEDTPLKLSVDPTRGSITIERQENTCLFCKSKDHLIEIETDVFFCESCLQKIKKLAFAPSGQKPSFTRSERNVFHITK